jgi:hypothetical protein
VAFGANTRAAQQLDERLDYGVRFNFHIGVDHARLGTEDGHAGGHQALDRGPAQLGVESHHFGNGIGAEQLVGVRRFKGHHAFACRVEHVSHVGEIQLAVRIVGGELIEVGEERFGLERVEAHVDFAQGELCGREHLLLDNGDNLDGFRRRVEDAAVPVWISWFRGGKGHRRVLGLVKSVDRGESARLDERGVAGEDKNVFVSSDGFASTLDRVAGAALLSLFHKADPGRGNRSLHLLRLMAHNGKDIRWRNDLAGRGDHMAQQRLAANFMQNLGALRLQARALAGGHDDDGELRTCSHSCFFLMSDPEDIFGIPPLPQKQLRGKDGARRIIDSSQAVPACRAAGW